jgi:hypothetical protein
VTSIVFVESALTSVSVIALGAVGSDVGDGVAVTVTVGAGLALAVGAAIVIVGMTISGDGVGVGVGATDAFATLAAVVAAADAVGGTVAGWNGLRPTAAVYAAGTAWTAVGLAEATADATGCVVDGLELALFDDLPENISR